MPFDKEKPELYGYLKVKKFEDMCNHFDRIPACDRRTDGRTSCDGIESRANDDHYTTVVDCR